jgi:hypothetical protein
MRKIAITIESQSLFDTHKCTVSPSVAVNPPAVQYFKGVDKNVLTGSVTDNRLEQISKFIIQMLSSKEYPNPPICSIAESEPVTKYVQTLLHNLKYCKQSTRFFYA